VFLFNRGVRFGWMSKGVERERKRTDLIPAQKICEFVGRLDLLARPTDTLAPPSPDLGWPLIRRVP
jgi:hypothetical protein